MPRINPVNSQPKASIERPEIEDIPPNADLKFLVFQQSAMSAEIQRLKKDLEKMELKAQQGKRRAWWLRIYVG